MTQAPRTGFTQADATELLIQWLRNPNYGSYGRYGYGVYLPALVQTYVQNQDITGVDVEQKMAEMMPMLYAAAWELCRRGILRPGIEAYNAQATADGASGNGYSITPFGKTWLSEAENDDFVPTEPERFAEMLAHHQQRFGIAFQERGQEAIRCYGAHAYLACCTMCGAAAESILLATAVAKADQAAVIAKYNASGGRRRVEKLVLGQVRAEIREECQGYLTLLKYWRDQAAHGQSSGISDNEAYTSLALLLRLAIFVEDNWEHLMQQPSSSFP
jgi:hypothetical protein